MMYLQLHGARTASGNVCLNPVHYRHRLLARNSGRVGPHSPHCRVSMYSKRITGAFATASPSQNGSAATSTQPRPARRIACSQPVAAPANAPPQVCKPSFCSLEAWLVMLHVSAGSRTVHTRLRANTTVLCTTSILRSDGPCQSRKLAATRRLRVGPGCTACGGRLRPQQTSLSGA